MISSRWVWFLPVLIIHYPLLKPAVSAGFSLPPFLKQNAPFPRAQIEQFCSLSMASVYRPTKANMLMISLVPPSGAFQNRASFCSRPQRSHRRPPGSVILFCITVLSSSLNDALRRYASALAISGSRIVAIGDDTATNEWRGNHTRTIDLQGKTAIPGLTDTHIHAIRGGQTDIRNLLVRQRPSLKDALDKYAPTLTVVPTING